MLPSPKPRRHVVFITSIGCDDILFPLNLFGGVLFWYAETPICWLPFRRSLCCAADPAALSEPDIRKKRAEEELQRSGIRYTIVRPGGLRDSGVAGNLVMEGPDAFGLPPRKAPGSVLRSEVAHVCVEALRTEEAVDKVVEIIQKEDAPSRSIRELFASV